jgi:Flp pilus assembly protein TadG
MKSISSARQSPRRGTALAQVVLCLTILIGILAIVLDGGVLLAERRRAQAVADAGALAAAADLYANYLTNNGVDKGTASASAVATANANGYTSSNSTVTTNVYPANYQGGPNAGKQVPVGYVEVTVTYNQTRFFSGFWGAGTIPVSARAVARGQWKPSSPALLLLNPTASGALTVTGTGSVAVKGGSIVVDSNSSSGIVTSGSRAVVTDIGQPILVSGNPGYSGGGVSPTPTPSQPPTPDPLRFLPEPSVPSPPPSPNPTTSGGVDYYSPGYYASGLKLSGGYTAVMQPGIYYMDGAFDVNGNGSSKLTGNGVMIFIGASGSISLAGQGQVILSPPTSGIYQGITLFQTRSSTQVVTITGNGLFNITGTLYAAGALMKVTGNGDASISSQIIADQLQNKGGGGGTGQVNVNYDSNNVGKTRLFNLVE